MAILMKKEKLIFIRSISPVATGSIMDSVSMDEVPDEIQRQYESLRIDVKRFGEELGSHPLYADLMLCWMVDVVGTGGDLTEEAMEDALGRLDFESFVGRLGGNLAALIQDVITNTGFRITDRGGGGGSWHVGVPCTEGDSRRLCGMLHIRFQKAIASGMIMVRKWYWGFRFPDLINWRDAERYLEEGN